MKRYLAVLLVCIFVSACGSPKKLAGVASVDGPPLYLVRDGKPACTIVIPDKADRWTTTPAGWLRDYVKKSSGATLEIVPESKAPSGAGALIALGDTKLARDADVDLAGLKWDACRLKVRDNVLFLRGIDKVGVKGREEYGPKGTMRAAAIFLEKFCGIRWLVPGSEGAYVPNKRDITVPRDLNMTSTPAFLYVRPFYGSPLHDPAAYANNCRIALKLKSYGGHSYYSWVPAKKYFKDHPEYFALIKGKRQQYQNHLCTSNPEVRRILLREIRKLFDEGYDWVQLGQEDGFKACECEKCRAQDEYTDHGQLRPGYTNWREQLKDYPCERLLELHRWIAEECYKSHPDKTVHLLVYSPTVMPSKRFDKWPPNVVAEMCTRDPEIVDLWKDKVRALTGYIYIFDVTLHGGLGVRATSESIAEVVRDMHKMKYIAAATCVGGYNWGLEGPVYYVEAKLFGDPTLDEKELLKEYCRGLYGRAAQPMQDFFELLYTKGEVRELLGDEAERFLYLYPPFFVERLERFLIKAERDADTERAKNWVKLTRDHFDYIKYLVQMLRAYRAYQNMPDDASWAAVRKGVNTFNAWRNRVLRYEKSYTDRWFPAYRYFANFLTGKGTNKNYYTGWYSRRKKVFEEGVENMSVGYGGSGIRMPILLDMNRPPIVKPAVVRRTKQAPAVDGRLDDNVWKGADVCSLHEMRSRKTDVRTNVRLLYDDKYLYVGWDCEEPQLDDMRVEETGPDGPAYSRECVELFLDMEGTLRRYVHFIAAAQKNSYYDERCGYKAFGSWDVSWNAKWDYAHYVDKPNKRWTLEMRIPFTELGLANPPKPGTEWLGNFGRERYLKETHYWTGIYIWSQKEAEGFNTPLNFGVIRFE